MSRTDSNDTPQGSERTDPAREYGQPGLSEQGPTLLIVVGVHPGAEQTDRFTGYALKERAERMDESAGVTVLVCSDVWVLNNDDAMRCAAVSVGPPSVNAMTAFLADRLPTALVADDRYVVQFDAQTDEPVAAVWGESPSETAEAAEQLAQRHLAALLLRAKS